MTARLTPAPPVPRRLVLRGDALERLRQLPDHSIDMVLTSPPYFRLRDYGGADQLGLEEAVDDWVERLLAVTSEIRRVLVPTGSLWLNLGDSYAAHPRQGAARKSLLLGPERLTLAMVAAGWVLRNKIVWAKTNPRPSSVRDRLTCSWEPVYLFTPGTSPGGPTFFDLDAVRQPHRTQPPKSRPTVPGSDIRTGTWLGPNSQKLTGLSALKAAGRVGHPLGKNPGDVWLLPSSSSRGGHHATFPVQLVQRMILAGCPEQRCRACRLPYRRTVWRLGTTAVRGALAANCSCLGGSEPGLVLDPFIGSGTTGLVAEQHGRDWLGIELNPDFAASAEQRIVAAGGGRPP